MTRLVARGLGLFLRLILFPTIAMPVAVLPVAGQPTTPDQPHLHLLADSPTYHLQYDKTEGSLVQGTFGSNRAERFSVTYLHTDAGPTGYSKHLAWLLARDSKGFALLWCYLDETGKDFWCWLYRYPENSLTTQHFNGEYRFAAPSIESDTSEPGFSLPEPPPYVGPPFVFAGWTNKAGAIDKLSIYESVSTEGTGTKAATEEISGDRKVTRTLEKLTVQPLHQLQVGGANGWRSGGWEELHAFAKDSAGDPYYLILYSNSKLGFVVDLKRARTYTADFGSRVTFNDDQKAFGPTGNPVEHEELPSVRRNQAYEIALTSTGSYDNPYTEVVLDVELTGPDRHTIRIPGFWDGGKTWKIRFAPPRVGNWTWKTFSNDKDIDGKIGVVECTPESDPTIGFLHVHPYANQSRHFAVGQATSFYPSFMYDPVQFDTPGSSAQAPINKAIPAVVQLVSTAPAGTVSNAASVTAQQTAKLPAAFVAFEGRMDALHAAGFNRLTGGYLLPGDTALSEPRNEGGTPFVGGDLYHLNADYFQWMDRRVAYCNSLGMIPDVGLARSPAIAFSGNNDAQLRLLWRYLLARYSAYDVCWNMFGPVPAESADALSRIQPFAVMQSKYDLFHHPLTSELFITPAYIKKYNAAIAAAAAASAAAPGAGGRSRLPEVAGPPLGLPIWMDVITVRAPDVSVLYDLYSVKKPIVAVSDGHTAGASDVKDRDQLWETRMHGAYYTIDAPAGPVPALDSPLLKAMETSNKFFQQTRYGKLDPHMELLEANRDETLEAARKRHLANIQAGVPVNTGDPNSSKDPKAVAPSALVLADQSREYALYFKHGGFVTIDLLEATGRIKVTWLNLSTGESREDAQIVGGAYHAFSAPDDKDWVLYLKRL